MNRSAELLLGSLKHIKFVPSGSSALRLRFSGANRGFSRAVESLPKGEGRGEGKRDILTPSANNKMRCAPSRASRDRANPAFRNCSKGANTNKVAVLADQFLFAGVEAGGLTGRPYSSTTMSSGT